MKSVGLHIRLTSDLADVIEKAVRLKIPFFQCFLTNKQRRYPRLTHQDIDSFLAIKRKHFKHLYIHGSYWINLCSSYNNGYETLKKELRIAKRLEFDHIILHPGAARGCAIRHEGIDFLVRALNRAMKKENDVAIVLENTAHGSLNVGSDIDDFHLLLTKLDYPDKVRFCIDTAHAYSYGYDLADDQQQDMFIELIEKKIGVDRVALIHLNDTQEQLGGRIDRHFVVGKGNIGQRALKRFMTHPVLVSIPVLLELPVLPELQEVAILNTVNAWTHTVMIKDKESEPCVLQ